MILNTYLQNKAEIVKKDSFLDILFYYAFITLYCF